MVQATDGYISTSQAVEGLLTHTGTAWSADHLAMVQATDGYNAVTLEQLLTHNDSASQARIADGVKAQKKMAAGFNQGFADRLLWTDGYISLP